MKQHISKEILSAVDTGRLSLLEGKRGWYSYIIDVHKLVWARNLRDGYNIYVYNKDGYHLETVRIGF